MWHFTDTKSIWMVLGPALWGKTRRRYVQKKTAPGIVNDVSLIATGQGNQILKE